MKLPNERQFVALGVFWLVVLMLLLGVGCPWLWGIAAFVDTFKMLATTALVGMIVAANYSINSNEKPAQPPATGKENDPVNVEVKP